MTVADRHPKLKLGKGASFFVKTQLRRLRQEDEIWQADFFPIPCSDSEHSSVWWGLVLSHSHENVLAQRMVEEPPNVNDLAGLLAEAMRRPLVDFSHRPRRLYLRARPEWAELLPHLKQIGIEAVSQDSLAKWDRNFGDLQAQVEQAKASKTKGQHPDDEEENMPDNTENSDTAFRELVRILEEAVQAGVTSLGLEYQGRELIAGRNCRPRCCPNFRRLATIRHRRTRQAGRFVPKVEGENADQSPWERLRGRCRRIR
jgi:hypothetical protein